MLGCKHSFFRQEKGGLSCEGISKMKKALPENLERYRITKGPISSTPSDGIQWVFSIPADNMFLLVVSSNEMGWDHVSVSTRHRTPTWDEMCVIKRLFFEDNETVIQYHPPESVYKNLHPYCLHMWRQHGKEIELPPIMMV